MRDAVHGLVEGISGEVHNRSDRCATKWLYSYKKFLTVDIDRCENIGFAIMQKSSGVTNEYP